MTLRQARSLKQARKQFENAKIKLAQAQRIYNDAKKRLADMERGVKASKNHSIEKVVTP